MSEQVNLFEVASRANYPLQDRVVSTLRSAHELFNTAWPSLEFLARHCTDTAGGWNGAAMVTDDEMAFHHLFLDQLETMLDAVAKKVREAQVTSEQRIWTAVTNRGSQGFVAHGKKFTVEGELIPTPPRKDTPEYEELLAWFRNSGREASVDVSIPWRTLQKTCDDLAAAGEQMPPHVKMSPKTGVRVGR